MEPHELTVYEASTLIRRGELSPVDLVEGLLERIERLEPQLEAWVTVNRVGALSVAEELEREAEDGEMRSPLHGIPVGIKDIFNTKGLTTTMGSVTYRKFVPDRDAESVRKLREGGAIMLGKTETTQFASSDHAPTRNPWNLEHTPGGSSSGSAAAVSSGMCPAALGSQTGGSVIRPASFCGVVGVKPTYDLISRQGVYPLSWTLDHVGFFTRTVEDASLILDALAGLNTNFSLQVEPQPPRIGIIEDYFREAADPEVWEGFTEAVDRLEDAGAEVSTLDAPGVFRVVHSSHRIIMASEAAAVHQEHFRNRRQGLRPKIRGLVASGMLTPAVTYLKAQRIRRIYMEEIREAIEEFSCIATPSTMTPALHGLEDTGDSSFNSPWSLAGLPTITLPSGLTDNDLPLGIQLVSKPHRETSLLTTANWCERILGFPKEPRNPAEG